MTRRIKIGKRSVLASEVEPAAICEMCGAKEELRPYGPKGENVCFDCGKKNEAAMEHAFMQRLNPQ